MITIINLHQTKSLMFIVASFEQALSVLTWWPFVAVICLFGVAWTTIRKLSEHNQIPDIDAYAVNNIAINGDQINQIRNYSALRIKVMILPHNLVFQSQSAIKSFSWTLDRGILTLFNCANEKMIRYTQVSDCFDGVLNLPRQLAGSCKFIAKNIGELTIESHIGKLNTLVVDASETSHVSFINTNVHDFYVHSTDNAMVTDFIADKGSFIAKHHSMINGLVTTSEFVQTLTEYGQIILKQV